MKKVIVPILFLLITILAVFSCEKDDICLDSEAKTSKLIIRFKDNNNHSLYKDATLLAIKGIGNADVIDFGTTDSIAIPLKTDLDLTQFEFLKNYEETTENSDQLDFNYTRTDEFISRACGYRTVFENLSTTIINDTNNWILDYEIVQTTITNEDEKHLIIYH